MGKEVISFEQIAQSILLLRGQKVMLDFDLATLYGVSTAHLKRAVQRNKARFPIDKHDDEIAAIIDAIRQLTAPPKKTAREIGFHVRETAPRYRVRKTPRRK